MAMVVCCVFMKPPVPTTAPIVAKSAVDSPLVYSYNSVVAGSPARLGAPLTVRLGCNRELHIDQKINTSNLLILGVF
jgi:hypothetical protein